MNFLAVDDEQFALKDLVENISLAVPDAVVNSFLSPIAALEYVKKSNIDVAFLDIEMSGMNGLELAKRIKDIQGRANIIFVTGYSQYAIDAFGIYASGYLLKPVSHIAIAESMTSLRNPMEKKQESGLSVQTFGNFEVFFNGTPVRFPRSKSKELFAYLIHKKGTSCTLKELAAILFENKEYNTSMQKQMQTIISTLIKTLKDIDREDVIIKQHNSIAVDKSKVRCDYYRFFEWDMDAVNSYTGEYMSNYDWGEFTVGYLDSKVL